MTDERFRLYLVTDAGLCPRERLEETVEAALRGGVTMVQLREKELDSRAFYQEALALKRITDAYGVPLIINDRLDIMLAVDAAGLHIGQKDLPAPAARRVMGPDKLLGISARTLAEARQAKADGADYLGVGAVFPTATKKDAVWVGRETLREIRTAVEIPVVGIGGIGPGNLAQLYGSGIDGVAVVSAIMASPDPEAAAGTLREMAGRL